MTNFVKRYAVLVVAVVTAAGAFAQSARAINPEQTNEWGVVNTLGYNLSTGYTAYGSINKFWAYTFSTWNRAYSKPGIRFYGGTYGNYATGCEHTSKWPNNGFYCWNDGGIYLDYPFMQNKLQSSGDYYPGAYLAHEWGHRIQHHLGSWSWYSAQGHRTEYHADCLAGMYTRYGYMTQRLTGNDYREGYNWLYYQPQSSTHGYGPNRAAWYEFGYTQYSLEACNRVFGGTATSSATGSASPGEGSGSSREMSADMWILPPATGPVDLTLSGPVTAPKGDATPPMRGRPLVPSARASS
jgi:predicted metalloprotease